MVDLISSTDDCGYFSFADRYQVTFQWAFVEHLSEAMMKTLAALEAPTFADLHHFNSSALEASFDSSERSHSIFAEITLIFTLLENESNLATDFVFTRLLVVSDNSCNLLFFLIHFGH